MLNDIKKSGGAEGVNNLKGSAILLLTAFIWGIAFAFQRDAMEHIGPFTFVTIRLFLGALTLSIIVMFGNLRWKYKNPGKKITDNPEWKISRKAKIGGVLCGLVMFFGTNLQQIGLTTTTASKAGFLTALYIVLVPIIGIFLKHKTHWNTWVSVAVSVVGFYLLSITSGFSAEAGDLVILLSAVFWAGHILVTNHFVGGMVHKQVLYMCVVQFLVVSLLSLILAPIFDRFFVANPFDIELIIKALPSVLYVGVLSTGIAFTTQAIGQKYAAPTVSALVMSLESVFGALGGIVLLHESLSGRETLGCALVFAAIILVEIPVGKRKG